MLMKLVILKLQMMLISRRRRKEWFTDASL